MRSLYLNRTLLFLCILFFAVSTKAQSNTCGTATTISTDSVCINTAGTLSGATADGGAIASGCTAINSEDVWYKFVAKTQFPVITVSGLGSSWGTRLKIQLLSGACGSFTQVACANHAGTSTSVTPSLTAPLIAGNTYHIRIYKDNIALPTGANWGFSICVTDPLSKGSRMNEVFSRTILSPATILNFPWEITYGRDNFLWVTESKGYKIYRMDPNTGVKTTVLDISQNSTFLPLADRTFNCQFANGSGAQGGLAGLALHPNFMDGTANEKNFVYISYIFSSNGGTSPTGVFFTNRLVQFTYNVGADKLESPRLISSLPGSSDHNSQRIIIAPIAVGGQSFLFYASGDMGSGQFGNRTRAMNAQTASNVEGKILRFNLDTTGGVPWIPTTNPYSSTSSVWSIGMRNNQGFAYDSALNILYGSSHGAYSDDEINIIQPFKNYGHPLVIGYADGNYNGNVNPGTNTSISAGAPWPDNSGASSCPPIGNETTRMNAIIAAAATSGNYKGPLFSAYATPAATITTTWQTNPGNAGWLSEAWSGLDLYQNKIIPGWSKSLVAAGLKWGRLLRLRLSTTGTKTLPSNLDSLNTSDTITYFQSTNRYRDLAFAPNGKDVFLIMDNSSATSGPGVGNPTVPACPGCVLKYSFLGYADAAGASTIPASISVTNGTGNMVNAGTTVTIDGSNNFLWVPITGPDGNILAEINAMGQNLGVVTSTFYKNSGAVRTTPNGTPYLDRSITINAQNQPSAGNPVNVRLYLTASELAALVAAPGSAVTNINQVNIFRNADANGSALTTLPTNITPVSRAVFGSDYVLKASIDTFSTFYFANATSVPITPMFTFTGSSLSPFATTFGTASNQQSYTISGLNLTPSQANGVSVTAPANYEVSLINESFTGTNGNTVTLSSDASGKIVGEPLNIYVRYNPSAVGAHAGNISHSGAGVTPATNVALSGNASGYFYSKATGSLTNMATWGVIADGSGPTPSAFNSNSQTFEIRNRPTASISANWVVSGASSKIVVASGTDFTIPSANIVTATIDVAAGGELTLNNTVLPTIGTLAANSTVEYAQTAAVNILNFSNDAVTYGNLKLSGAGTKTFKINSTTVTGNLVYDGLTNGALPLSAATAQATTLNLGGNLTYMGAVTNPNDVNCYVLNSTASGTQTITGNNNLARFFRIVTGTAGNNIFLSAIGGTTHAYLGNANSGGLTLSNATTFTLGGNTLTLIGPVNAGSGTITGSPTSNIIIGGTALNQALNFTQTNSGTRSLNNLTINAAASATLNAALELYSALSVNTASLNLNNQQLTLKSTAAATARVGNLTGSTLTNASNVTVERYIANPKRSWHLLGAKAVTGSQSIYNSWQEGGAIVANKGTWMTSGSTLLPGFDGTSVNGSSILIHDQTVPSWTTIPVANTNSTALSSRQGYMLFVRGDRSCTAGNALVTPTVVKANGLLTQGNINVTVSSTGVGKTLVGNPYASPINFENIAGTANLDQNFMVWDPALTGNHGLGGYRVVVRTGVNAYDQTPVLLGGTVTNDPTIQYIHSGQAFFVHATGANANINFTEACKAVTPTVVYNPIVATGGDQQLIANLMLMNAGNATLLDGLRIYYAPTNSATTIDDINKVGNFNENISSYKDGLKLIVERRPMISARDTIFLRMTNTTIRDYRLQIGTIDFVQTNAVAYLQDIFLSSTTLLDVTSNAINNIDFSITADPASANQDRFRIVFALTGPLPTTFTSVKASQQGSNIAVEWKVSNQVNIEKYEVEKSIDGITFSKVVIQTATSGSDAVYNWLDMNPVAGNNFYRIRSIGSGSDIKISQVVKVTIGKGNSSIVVYPNPVTKRIVAVQFNEMVKGNYQLRLISTAGQVVHTQSLKHNGGSATQTIKLGSQFANAVYLLEITNPDNLKTTKTLVITE